MTDTIQNTKSMLADIKTRLKTETDKEKLYKLAVWGEELNTLLRELQGQEPEMKYCKWCAKVKPLPCFGMAGVSGKRYRRNKCNACTWGKRKRLKSVNYVF